MEGLIRGIRESDLKFLGHDSGCSVETGLERDRIACRGPRQAVWWELETAEGEGEGG